MIHQKRRTALLEQLDDGAVVIISTNQEQLRNGDVHFPFRPDSSFYYLTGFEEPESIAVISKKSFTIFLREKDKSREVWDGERLGVDSACEKLGADNAYSIKQVDKYLPKLIEEKSNIYFDSKSTDLDRKITKTLINIDIKSASKAIGELRLIKDDKEISTIKQACKITAKAHTLAMKTAKPNMLEYELQSVFDMEFTKANTLHAYMPIVAGGKNACTLHYIKNNKKLIDGDLVLIDAGCELDCYASDITRTFPINGKFSQAQRDVYQIVLDAQYKAIECIRAGNRINQMHEAASQAIKQGLMELGIIKSGHELTNHYMHGTGHFLGMDVHDVGEYKSGDDYKEFEVGMITTVEPGIYIREDDKIDPIYHNIGIRIEDDVLVTDNGCKVLTDAVVKEIKDIESLMK